MILRGLYAITPERGDSAALFDMVRAALEGGITLLQYRRKSLPREMKLIEAIELAKLARQRAVPFIVNDDIDLALEAGADGVHVGRDDAAVSDCKKKMPGLIVGASCYGDLRRAESAVAAGADYVAFGSVFASSTKPDATRAPLTLFAQARPLGVPLAAIGGISLDNAPSVIAAGADLLAVISDLFDAPDVAERARWYRKLFT